MTPHVVPDLSVDVEAETVSIHEAQRVVLALRHLAADWQALLRMVLTEPAPSYREIAAALDIAVGTIGPRRARCLSSLRAAYNNLPG
ncbi:MAG: RNA polymerase sigma factor [Acidimicrobiales bacterium]